MSPWISTKAHLPADQEHVLAWIPASRCRSGGKELHLFVVTFWRGRTREEIEAGDGVWRFADQVGNTREPYRWTDITGTSWWGQEATFWQMLPDAPPDVLASPGP